MFRGAAALSSLRSAQFTCASWPLLVLSASCSLFHEMASSTSKHVHKVLYCNNTGLPGIIREAVLAVPRQNDNILHHVVTIIVDIRALVVIVMREGMQETRCWTFQKSSPTIESLKLGFAAAIVAIIIRVHNTNQQHA